MGELLPLVCQLRYLNLQLLLLLLDPLKVALETLIVTVTEGAEPATEGVMMVPVVREGREL